MLEAEKKEVQEEMRLGDCGDKLDKQGQGQAKDSWLEGQAGLWTGSVHREQHQLGSNPPLFHSEGNGKKPQNVFQFRTTL